MAEGDSPAGPFRDSGRALITGGEGFEAIDPMVVPRPSNSGRWLLYAGGSAGAKLRVWELDDTMDGDPARGSRRDARRSSPRASSSTIAGAKYYLSYSHGWWQGGSYSASYSTGPTPFGPWTYGGRILGSDANHKGPGHHAIFRKPGSDDWYIAFHEWPGARGDGPYQGSRKIAIERLRYDRDGRILPVRIADDVPKW